VRTRPILKILVILPLVASVATICIGIYMAQPWGDNNAYQGVGDYFVLTIFLAWAVSPYLYFLDFARRGRITAPGALFTLIAALLVCCGGVFLLVDAAFMHMDAQSGLVIVVLPVYQWLAIGILYGITRIWIALDAN